MVFSVKRKIFAGVVTPSTATTGQFWQYVQPEISGWSLFGTGMNGISNLAEYQALFDVYKVHGIKLHFRPRYNLIGEMQSVPTSGVSTTDHQYVSFIMDKMSTATPVGAYSISTYNSFTELGNVITKRADRPFSIYLRRPVVSDQTIAGASYSTKQPWLNLGSAAGTDQPLRGFHMFMHTQTFTSSVFPTLDVYATYYVSFRGMK